MSSEGAGNDPPRGILRWLLWAWKRWRASRKDPSAS